MVDGTCITVWPWLHKNWLWVYLCIWNCSEFYRKNVSQSALYPFGSSCNTKFSCAEVELRNLATGWNTSLGLELKLPLASLFGGSLRSVGRGKVVKLMKVSHLSVFHFSRDWWKLYTIFPVKFGEPRQKAFAAEGIMPSATDFKVLERNVLRVTREDNSCRDHFLLQVNDLVYIPSADGKARCNVVPLSVYQMVWTLLRQEVPFVAGTIHELEGTDAVIFLANTCARQVDHPSNTLAQLPNQTSSRSFFENFLDQLGSLNIFFPSFPCSFPHHLEVVNVGEEQHRFPISELRRRFMRDDGATCEGLKRFTCVLHAFYNDLHGSRLFNETFRTWSYKVMITPPWCIWMMLRFWRISRLATRSWTQSLAQRLGRALHGHFITSIAQGGWNLYLHCQCIWTATKVRSQWEGVRCAHICTLHRDAVVKAAYALRWLKKGRFVDAFVLCFRVFEDHVVFESLQIFIQAFQHVAQKMCLKIVCRTVESKTETHSIIPS